MCRAFRDLGDTRHSALLRLPLMYAPSHAVVELT
jgi:hypothetical protein